jgi:hypothetical protein
MLRGRGDNPSSLVKEMTDASVEILNTRRFVVRCAEQSPSTKSAKSLAAANLPGARELLGILAPGL